jgi:hypothetical protein
MTRRHKPAARGGISAAMLYAGAVALVVVPSAGFALGAVDGGGVRAGLASFTPASIDARLAQLIGNHRDGGAMRFTPAGATARQGRSVTVAVRVDGNVDALSVRSALGGASEDSASAVARIAPTRFSLGTARGYQSFAKPAAPALTNELSDAAIPDLAAFRPSPGVKEKPSRFAARIAVEEEQGASRSTRALDRLGDQTFDLGGSYRVTRNLDVTAGVRYSQERDRIEPLINGKQDSQAVYVGTQFRF